MYHPNAIVLNSNFKFELLSFILQQETAENVCKVTSTALDYTDTTNSFITQEKNIGAIATSTPRNSESERVFNPDADSSNLVCDSDVGTETVHDTSEDSHKSEVSFSLTPLSSNVTPTNEKPKNIMPSQNDTVSKDSSVSSKKLDKSKSDTVPESQVKKGRLSEDPYDSQVKTSVADTSVKPNESIRKATNDPIKVNLGPKRESKEWYQKDFYITNTPLMQRKSPESSPREEKERAHTEEKVSLLKHNVLNFCIGPNKINLFRK